MSQFPKDRRETWITGIGIVSSLGEGLEAAWEALHPESRQCRSKDICATKPNAEKPGISEPLKPWL